MPDTKRKQKRINFRSMLDSEPDWLYNKRKNAWGYYNDSEYPSRVQHLWRYSDPAGFDINDPVNQLLDVPVSTNGHAKGLKPLSDDYAATAHIRGDRVTIGQLHNKYKNSGIIISSLHDAARNHPEIVQDHLGSIVDEHFGKIESANMALWNSGIFVYIPDNLEIAEPIYLDRHPTGLTTINRVLIVTGKNSRITLVDHTGCHCSKDQAYVNSVKEMIVGESSSVSMIEIQDLPDGYTSITTNRNRLSQNASLKTVSLSLGAEQAKSNIGTLLDGPGAEAKWYGMLYGNDNQKFDHHTIHEHLSGNTFSDLVFKVALRENSESAYTGMIRIDESAKNCEAYQENRNLLLSDSAKAESIPELEISNDDVRCSHGVTMGKVDPEMLFYLESRGIDATEAVQMIVEGFFGAVLEQVPEVVYDSIYTIVSKRMGEVDDGQRVS